MRIEVWFRDGSSRIFENVLDVQIMEPGMVVPPPQIPGRLVLSAAAIVAWMVLLPEEHDPRSGTTETVDLVEGAVEMHPAEKSVLRE